MDMGGHGWTELLVARVTAVRRCSGDEEGRESHSYVLQVRDQHRDYHNQTELTE